MTTSQGRQALAARSASFLENKGQWDRRAKFLAKGSALDLWFTDTGIRYDQHPSLKVGSKHQVVDMFFVDGRPTRHEGRRDAGMRSDFYVSGNVALNARSYKELYARNVATGVDMRTYFDGGRPRYDLIVAPGAKTSAIKIGFRGAEGLSIKKGELVVGTQLGGFTNGKPYAYQKIDGKQKPVPVRWTLLNGDTAAFETGSYDHTKPLIIDPVVYGTYFGGDNGVDEVRSIVSDTAAGGTEGSVLVTGGTRAPGFPTSTGINNYNNPIGVDAFLSRLQGDAYNRDYSVFVGSQGYDIGKFIKLDAVGNIWIAGLTTSNQFFDASGGSVGTNDIFVLRFNNNGVLIPQVDPNGFLRFGAAGQDDILTGFDVLKTTPTSVSGPTEFVIAGLAPTTAPAGFPGTHPGVSTGYVATYTYQGGTFTRNNAASGYMVGAGGVRNEVRGAVYGANGDLYVAGAVYGSGNQNTDPRTGGNPNLFFTTSDVFKGTSTGYDGGQLLRNTDIFVRKYDATTRALVYSGFIGGSGPDDAGGIAVQQGNSLTTETDYNFSYTGSTIAVDDSGYAYVTGVSRSFNFPRTNGVYGEVFNQFETVTVSKINPSGSAIVYSTNLRNSSGSVAGTGIACVVPAGIGVDGRGNAFITGNLRPTSITFPNTPGDPNEPSGMSLPSINIPAGLADVPDPLYESPATPEFPTSEGFIVVLNPTATGLEFASYLGGILDDFVYAPYVDNNGDVWAMGWTDGRRDYSRPNAAGTSVNRYNRTGSLPTSLITGLALKSSPDVSGGGPATIVYPFAYGAVGTQGATTPPFVTGTFARDGFIVKFRVNQASVASVTLNPATIPGGLGASSTGTVTLSQAAPSGGAQIRVSLPNGTTYASLSATDEDVDTITLDIPAGATQANFTIYSKAVLENQLVKVRATYTGTFKETTLQVVPWLVSLQLPSNTMVGGDPNNLRGVVTLAAPAPAGGVEIALTTSNSAVQFVTKPFVIPAGQTSAQFEISSDGVDDATLVTIQASLLGLTRSADITLVPANLQSITLTPSTVAGGSPTVATVTLNGKAGNAPYVVTITSDNANAVVPAGTTITVAPQNVSSTTGVTIDTKSVTSTTTATITATHAATPGHPTVSKSATLTIQPVLISGLTLDPTSVDSGERSRATVTLSTAAPAGGARVYVSTSNTAVAVVRLVAGGALPSDANGFYVTVPAGETSVEFDVLARYVGVDTPVTVTATGGTGAPKSAVLTVKALAYTFTIDPTSVVGSSTGSTVITGTVEIPNPAQENIVFTVSTNNSTVFPAGSFDATVTIPAGQTVGTFVLRPQGVTTQTSVTITVSFGGGSKTAVLEVRPVGLSALVSRQKTVRSGTGQINLTAFFEAETSTPGQVLTLTTNLPSAFPTGTFTLQRTGEFAGKWTRTYTIPAGVTSQALFPALMTKRISRSQNVTFTAYYSGTSASTTVTIAR